MAVFCLRIYVADISAPLELRFIGADTSEASRRGRAVMDAITSYREIIPKAWSDDEGTEVLFRMKHLRGLYFFDPEGF